MNLLKDLKELLML